MANISKILKMRGSILKLNIKILYILYIKILSFLSREEKRKKVRRIQIFSSRMNEDVAGIQNFQLLELHLQFAT